MSEFLMLSYAATYVNIDKLLHAKSLSCSLAMSGGYLAEGRNATVGLSAAFTFLLAAL
jgi:hypothetical protein